MRTVGAISSPNAYARSIPSTAAPPPPSPTASIQASPPVSADSLSARVQDSLALSGSSGAALNQSATELATALSSLQQLNGNGPQSSLLANVQQFASSTLPSRLADLNQAVSDLSSRLSSAAPGERDALQSQLQATQELVALYQEAAQVLQASPLLQPEQPSVAAVVPTSSVDTPPDQGRVLAEGTRLADRITEADRAVGARRDESHFFISNTADKQRRAEAGIFGQQARFFAEQAGGYAQTQPELQNLAQNLSSLYETLAQSTAHSTRERPQVIETARAAIAAAYTSLSETDSAALSPEARAEIQQHLRDLSLIVDSYAQFAGQDIGGFAAPTSLDQFTSTVIQRQREFQGTALGNQRTPTARTPATIAGALASLPIDRAGMQTIIQRNQQLETRLQSGQFRSRSAYIDAVLATAPQTSSSFRASLSTLAGAQYDAYSAQKTAEAGRDRAAQARATSEQALGTLDEAQSLVSSANRDLAQARQLLAQYHSLAAQSRGESQDALRLRDQALALQASAQRGLAQVRSSTFGPALTSLTQGAEQNLAQVSSLTAQLDADIASTTANLAEGDARAEALDTEITDIETQEALAAQAVAASAASGNAETIPVDLNMSDFAAYLAGLNSEGDSIKLVISADGRIGPAFAALRAKGEISLSITMLDNGKYAVKVSIEGQAGAQVGRAGVANASAMGGLNGALTYTFSSPSEVNAFLIDTVRDSLGDLTSQVLPNLADAPDMSHIRPSTQSGVFFELAGEISFGSLQVTGVGRASRIFTVGSTGREGMRESVSGSLGFRYGNISVTGGVERYSVTNNSNPESNGQYLSANANISYNLTPELKRTLSTNSAAGRREVRQNLETIGSRLGLEGEALRRFALTGVSQIESAVRNRKTNISLTVSAVWQVNTTAPNLSDAPRAPIGRLSSVNVGVGASYSDSSSVDVGLASASVSLGASQTDNTLFIQDTIAAQDMYFGTPAARQRLLSNGMDYPLTGADNRPSTLGAEIRRFEAMERYADSRSGGDPVVRERLMYEQRTQGRVFE
ncbi:MAG: hypothetical protein ACO1RX_14775 [Candidatus Sericytochromatia bacterium]